jgi:hypothetical protein
VRDQERRRGYDEKHDYPHVRFSDSDSEVDLRPPSSRKSRRPSTEEELIEGIYMRNEKANQMNRQIDHRIEEAKQYISRSIRGRVVSVEDATPREGARRAETYHIPPSKAFAPEPPSTDELPRRSSARRDRTRDRSKDRRGTTRERKHSYDRIVPTMYEPHERERERDSPRPKPIPPLQSHRSVPSKMPSHHHSPPTRSHTEYPPPRHMPSDVPRVHLNRSSTMPATPSSRTSKNSRPKHEVYDSAYASCDYSSGDQMSPRIPPRVRTPPSSPFIVESPRYSSGRHRDILDEERTRVRSVSPHGRRGNSRPKVRSTSSRQQTTYYATVEEEIRPSRTDSWGNRGSSFEQPSLADINFAPQYSFEDVSWARRGSEPPSSYASAYMTRNPIYT